MHTFQGRTFGPVSHPHHDGRTSELLLWFLLAAWVWLHCLPEWKGCFCWLMMEQDCSWWSWSLCSGFEPISVDGWSLGLGKLDGCECVVGWGSFSSAPAEIAWSHRGCSWGRRVWSTGRWFPFPASCYSYLDCQSVVVGRSWSCPLKVGLHKTYILLIGKFSFVYAYVGASHLEYFFYE